MHLAADLIESCETRFFPEVELWTAVAKGPNARAVGAVSDVALGLVTDACEKSARKRAAAEALERYGATLAGLRASARSPAFDRCGRTVGTVSARAVFLPWVGPTGAVLPADSEGLAFGATRQDALRRAALERIERRALRHALSGAGALSPMRIARTGELGVELFSVPAHMPVVLGVICDNGGRIVGAGAGAAPQADAAARHALEEAALAWLCSQGKVLPGLFDGRETLLARFGVTVRSELPISRSTAASAPAPDIDVFADAGPARWAARSAYVVRALSRCDPAAGFVAGCARTVAQ